LIFFHLNAESSSKGYYKSRAITLTSTGS